MIVDARGTILAAFLTAWIGFASPRPISSPLYWLVTLPMCFACGVIVAREMSE